ncbi:hypothetical protein GC175_19890 [bacterium]|nr:hypothetical protein [bacterium]
MLQNAHAEQTLAPDTPMLRQFFTINRWLTLFGFLALAMIGLTLGLSFVDDRLVSNAPIWIKPLKFALSLSINTFTILWLLRFLQGQRWARIAGNMVAVASLVEIVIISGQAARGVGSHFNFGTVLDGVLFSIMGIFVYVLWGGMLIIAILLMRQRFEKPALAWALRLGLFITLAGGLVGQIMVMPTADQMAVMQDGMMSTLIGAHSVGAVDDRGGLPFVGWNTEGGDLRAPHFFGLHAIQLLALIGGLLSTNRFPRLRQKQRVGLVWVAALGYAAFFAITLWQALSGEPLFSPSGATLAAYGVLVGAVGLSGWGVMRNS